VSKWQAAYLGEKGMEIYQMAGQGKAELLYSVLSMDLSLSPAVYSGGFLF